MSDRLWLDQRTNRLVIFWLLLWVLAATGGLLARWLFHGNVIVAIGLAVLAAAPAAPVLHRWAKGGRPPGDDQPRSAHFMDRMMFPNEE